MDAERLLQAMGYAVLGGGKRMRAALVVLLCEHLGGTRQAAGQAACAVEFIHAYSLVHDDLPCMDDDLLRRGKPSCHAVYGEWLAVLAGDALQALAFEVLAEAPAEHAGQAVRVLALACGARGMVGGQFLDMQAQTQTQGGATDTAMADLVQRMHAGKTAALIAACARLGALCAGAKASSQETASRLGAHLGLAFQAIDDVLDVEESAQALGKTAGKDAAHDKFTLVRVLGLEGARSMAQRHTREALQAAQELGASELDLLGQFSRLLLARRS